ncbi:pectinesterase-like [Senna tora]|uniref:Pectinesterase n=1 Tax=Senna tora TaxID=362788 RepID=A0A834SKS4_9FABA|nr:pectinesterase-like [Senna tora]
MLIPSSSSSLTLLPHHLCEQSLEKQRCVSHVSELLTSNDDVQNLTLLRSFLMESTSHIHKAMHKSNSIKQWSKNINILKNTTPTSRDQVAFSNCEKLLELSMHRLGDSMMALRSNSNSTRIPLESQHDAHTWLTSVLSYHVTCLEGLEGLTARAFIEADLENLISRAKTSLDMFVAIFPPKEKDYEQALVIDQFPSWVASEDRKLLESSSSVKDVIKPNVVVAKDGSGNFKTVSEAVASAPNNAQRRFVILVKKGTYVEQVNIGKIKSNLMLVGEGMDATIITGSLNNKDGRPISISGTISSDGPGLILKDLCIQNTAGPQKDQAVALRANGDRTVVYRCRIEAFQDTLYAQAQRQFYRECIIAGTVDFIFGDASTVIQNSKIIARRPMNGQSNIVTAQKRSYPKENTGTSIQHCDIIPSPELGPVIGGIKTYLGRPWGSFSRTVVMESFIDKHVDPAGWQVWSSDEDPMVKTKTLYYGEYENKGPGADISRRVKWSGFHVITNRADAFNFTVGRLINGGAWLPSTGVPFDVGL